MIETNAKKHEMKHEMNHYEAYYLILAELKSKLLTSSDRARHSRHRARRLRAPAPPRCDSPRCHPAIHPAVRLDGPKQLELG